MSHTQTIPEQTLVWEHNKCELRRCGTPSSPPDEAKLRYWGVTYGAYPNADDAKWLRNAVVVGVPIRVYGDVMDSFFWDESRGAAGEYTMTELQVYECLRWFFTDNPTAEELALTADMEVARQRMEGVTLFSGTPYSFTITPLPAERAVYEEE